MMVDKIKNIKELKLEKEGLISPSKLMSNINMDGVKQIVYVLIDEEGYLKVGYSHSNSTLKILGMLETAKLQIANELLMD